MELSVTRRKFVSLLAAAALAASMIVAAPATALAADATSGSIIQKATAVTTTVGAELELANFFDRSLDPADGDYHFDYVEVESTDEGVAAATVNKHNGKLIATTTGTVTVDVYLLAGTAPTGNNGKPCTNFTVLDQETITVTVESASSYGFQGTGANTIKVTSPTVSAYDADATDGFVNTLSGLTAVDGYYYITYQQAAGFRGFDGADAYEATNGQHITLEYYDANEEANVTAVCGDASGVISVSEATHSTKTITLKIDASQVSLGGNTLSFASGLQGNNTSSVLGCTVQFTF